MSTRHFSHDELVAIQGEAFQRFMADRVRRPWRALRKMGSLEDAAYTMKLGMRMLKMVAQNRFAKRGIAALWK